MRKFSFKYDDNKKGTKEQPREEPKQIEETQMTDEFKAKRTKYSEYAVAVQPLTAALALIIHPAPAQLIEGEDEDPADPAEVVVDGDEDPKTPMETLAAGIQSLIDKDDNYDKEERDEVTDKADLDKMTRLMHEAGKAVSAAAQVTQDHEDLMRTAMRPLRHFLADGPFQSFTTAINNFDE